MSLSMLPGLGTFAIPNNDLWVGPGRGVRGWAPAGVCEKSGAFQLNNLAIGSHQAVHDCLGIEVSLDPALACEAHLT